MNYPNIHKLKLTHERIAKLFGYKNVNSFRCSSAHKRIMKGINDVIGDVMDNIILPKKK